MSGFHLNEQIARLRKKNNLTQEKFASLLGVSNQAVSKWEAGACCPDIQLLPAIARCFGVSIDALFTQDDYESRSRLMTRYECTNRDEDFAAALDAYEKVIASGSATAKDLRDHAFLFNYRGFMDLSKAERLYEDALRYGERDETYYLIHSNLIRLLCRRGRNEEAIARYTQRADDEPDNWWSYALLSLAYWMSGKTRRPGRSRRNRWRCPATPGTTPPPGSITRKWATTRLPWTTGTEPTPTTPRILPACIRRPSCWRSWTAARRPSRPGGAS